MGEALRKREERERMQGKKRTVTLKDIAQATGYSVNTVSRALRDKEDIAQETRKKIQEIAREMGHVSNTLAASLRLGYTNTIAVILGDISNPHFAIMMKEIEARARKSGYTSILLNTSEDEQREREAIRLSLNKNVDGIIICPTQKTRKNLEYLEKTGIPFVLIGRSDEACSYAVCDDRLGGYQAAKALLDAGHTEILFLNGASYISSARERLEGYRAAHAEAGVPVREELVREVPVTSNGCEPIFVKLDKEQIRYTAVLAFSDMIAWEAWCCLLRRGKSVPGDCSLIGFDHIQSRLSLPFDLTSVSTYKRQMSADAVDILIAQMRREGEKGQEKEREREQRVIRTALAGGSTVAAPAAGEGKAPAGTFREYSF